LLLAGTPEGRSALAELAPPQMVDCAFFGAALRINRWGRVPRRE